MPAGGVTPETIQQTIQRGARRLLFNSEAELQEGLAALLADEGIDAAREVRLDVHDRPDLMAGSVVIEAKVKGGSAEVTRQLCRYARHPEVTAIVLVTTRARHYREVPADIDGVPVLVAWIRGVTGR